LGVDSAMTVEAHVPRAAAPASIEAARFYAKGLEALQRYELIEARDLLLRAEQADPQFALTHRALADVWVRLGYESRGVMEAKLAVERMRELPRADQLQIEAMLAHVSHDWKRTIEIRDSLCQFYPDNVDFA